MTKIIQNDNKKSKNNKKKFKMTKIFQNDEKNQNDTNNSKWKKSPVCINAQHDKSRCIFVNENAPPLLRNNARRTSEFE